MKNCQTLETIHTHTRILLNEKGSIVIYVIVSLIFLTIVLISMLAASKNSLITALKAQETIKNTYENDVANADEIYKEKLKSKYDREYEETTDNKYQEVAYVESTGIQWIDTGFCPNQDTRWVLDANITYPTATSGKEADSIMGCRYYASSNDYKQFIIGKNYVANNKNFCYDYGTSEYKYVPDENSYKIDYFNKRHIFDMNKNKLKIDDYLANTLTNNSFSFSSPYSLFIFAINDDYGRNGVPQADFFSKAKLFGSKIYDNGNLVRDFIPCRTKTTVTDVKGNTCAVGTVGLYDKVNDKFYSPEGGTLTAGNDVLKFSEQYQEVAYIESTGTQYINTKFCPNQDTRWVLDANITYPTATSGDAAYSLMGSRTYPDSTNQKNFYIGKGNAANDNNFWLAYGNSGSKVINENLYNTRHIFDVNKNILSADNSQIITMTYANFSVPYPLFIFALNEDYNNSGVQKTTGYAKAKLFASKIYNNGVLAKDFVPCYTKTTVSDENGNSCAVGTIGLYDRVERKFYTNQGTGTFLKKKINENFDEKYQKVEYVESDGSLAYFDSRFIANQDTRVVMDFQISKACDGKGFTLFGSRTNVSSNGYSFQKISSNNYLGGMYGSTLIQGTSTVEYDISRHIVDKNKNIVYLDSEEIMTFNNSTSFNCPSNLLILNMYNNTTLTTTAIPSGVRLYSFELYDNGTLIRNFIPCRTKTVVTDVEGNSCAAGTVGLYDTLNKEFYSPKGGGTLTAGSDVN